MVILGNHDLAEYIFCLSLRGLFVDWLELMGKEEKQCGQRASLGGCLGHPGRGDQVGRS